MRRGQPTKLRTMVLAGWTVALAAGCKAPPPPPAAPPIVVVAAVVQRDVPVIKEWIGTTAGDITAEIRPNVSGYLLRRVYQEGSLVRKGQLLFEIDPRQFQAQMQQAAANVGEGQAQLAKTERDVTRYRPLAAERAISQQELDNAVAAEEVAKANVAALQAALDQARLNLSWTKVLSPIDGIAGVSQAQVGNLVNQQSVLAVLSRVDPIRVLFNLSEQEYLQARQPNADPTTRESIGELSLVLTDGQVFAQRGHLIFTDREVDPKTGTIGAVGLFPNPGNVLRPGQYAKVRAETSIERNALLVPQRAVNEIQGAYQIAVIGPDHRADVRTVQAGQQVGKLWLIVNGIHPGEQVVVDGFSRVKTGQVVNPHLAENEAEEARPPAGPSGAGNRAGS
jgi:membrane fusion protein (multidrug efflux system)